MNSPGDFIWYELLTEDASAASSFYGRILGWTVRDAAGSVRGYRIIGTGQSDVGGMMEIPPDAKARGMRPIWLGYVAVDDVDAAAAKIVAEGGTQQMPPTDIPGVGRIAMLADPQGAGFYVMRGVMDGTSNAFAPDRVGHCHWHELLTTDQGAAWTFYGSQFGWTKGDSMPMGDMGDYEFIDHRGDMVGAVMRPDEGKRPRWRFYFGVPDIDQAVRDVAEGGGTIAYGPAEIPGGQFAMGIVDPQGAECGLVGPRNS